MAYEDINDLNRRTADKVLKNKVCNIDKIQNMMNINMDLPQRFIIFLTKQLQLVLLKKNLCKMNN